MRRHLAPCCRDLVRSLSPQVPFADPGVGWVRSRGAPSSLGQVVLWHRAGAWDCSHTHSLPLRSFSAFLPLAALCWRGDAGSPLLCKAGACTSNWEEARGDRGWVSAAGRCSPCCRGAGQGGGSLAPFELFCCNTNGADRISWKAGRVTRPWGELQDVPLGGTQGERKAVAVPKSSALGFAGLEFGGKVRRLMPAQYEWFRALVLVTEPPSRSPKHRAGTQQPPVSLVPH